MVERESQRRSEAAVAVDRGDETIAAIAHTLATVADEESREARIRERETDLQLAAGRVRDADVANDEARALLVERDRSRDVRLFDARVGVAHVEVADVPAELPLQR